MELCARCKVGKVPHTANSVFCLACLEDIDALETRLNNAARANPAQQLRYARLYARRFAVSIDDDKTLDLVTVIEAKQRPIFSPVERQRLILLRDAIANMRCTDFFRLSSLGIPFNSARHDYVQNECAFWDDDSGDDGALSEAA